MVWGTRASFSLRGKKTTKQAPPGYLALHPGMATLSAADHGYAIAMTWGAGILLVAAVPVVFLLNARAPLSPRRTG